MRRVSELAAIDSLLRFFNKINKDRLSLEEASRQWGRNVKDKEKERQWLRDRIMHLKEHSLAKPIYEFQNKRHILSGLELTIEGKKRLGRDLPSPISDFSTTSVDGFDKISEISKMIANFNRSNTNLEVELVIKSKK